MTRIYLSKSGQVLVPTAGNSHYALAISELGPDWRGSADEAYAAMWQLGWVRAVDYGDKIYAERYLDGVPVKIADLSKAQRAWLEDQVLAGKQLIWNDVVFSLTSEAKQGQTDDLVNKLIF